jgi:tetratricopeptide (TPR) repeat protein
MVPFLLALPAALVEPAAATTAVQALVQRSEASRRAGRIEEALRILEEAGPDAARASAVDRVRLRLQRARCAYYRTSLDGTPYDAIAHELKRIAADAEPTADKALVADAKDQLGVTLYRRDFRATDQAPARALFEDALRARRAAGDRRAIAESLFHVALTWENKKDPTPGELARSRALLQESLAIAEAGGFDVEASYAVRHLAGHRQDAGDLDGALAGFERSLALREKAGYTIYLAPSLLAIGDVWKDKKDPAKARLYFERARAEADRLGAARFQKMADEALKSLDTPPANP